ncbi:MAG TPA: translocation/assembly module TamB domain-containing protein, partial [Thermodesulfobacteriota bacterium]|nr:translocation/assembly module TamB domain-containing protein [Thermodesulfobacteriota bacterium]
AAVGLRSHGNEPESPPAIQVEIPSGSAVFDWGPEGLSARMTLDLQKNGFLQGAVTAPEPAGFAAPREAKGTVSWKELDLSVFQRFLPERLFLYGRANGQIEGVLSAGDRLEVSGNLQIAQGNLSWKEETGLISAGLNHSSLDFTWKGDKLRGNVDLTLLEYGFLRGEFLVPFSSRPPFQFVPSGALQVVLRGQAREKGLLSALFPTVVEESKGKLDISLQAGGTWAEPALRGSLDVTEAGAYLPSLGIRVEDVSTHCRLQGNELSVESLQARSGPGTLSGTAALHLKNGGIERFEGTLTGDRFQILYRPDIRIQSSPKLNFQGTAERISVRGEILLPAVQVYEVGGPGTVKTSPDVIIVDEPPRRESRRTLDVQVKIVMGDDVRVKAGGIDTRLGGSVDFKMAGLNTEDMTARGEIKTLEGTFIGYGLEMRIDRGRVIYDGGLVDNPGLDILALKKSVELQREDIRVGVAVLGTLKKPNVKLYSQPAMKDEDILSYLLVGRPYDPKQGNLGLLVKGAAGLLSGASPGVVDRLKGELGIDTLDIQAGTSTAPTGTTPLSSALPAGTSEFQRSLVTVGKYLTPQLYVSYGYSVFTNEQLLTLRYQISKRWEVETRRGNALGIDLFYRIYFY